MLPKEFGELFVFIFFHLTFLGNVLTISQDSKNVYSKLSTINSRLNQTMMFLTWLKPSRIVRDTYDEREKLVSSYKLISKTQCLLTMSPWTGHVHATRLNNIDDQDQSKNSNVIRLESVIGINDELGQWSEIYLINSLANHRSSLKLLSPHLFGSFIGSVSFHLSPMTRHCRSLLVKAIIVRWQCQCRLVETNDRFRLFQVFSCFFQWQWIFFLFNINQVNVIYVLNKINYLDL